MSNVEKIGIVGSGLIGKSWAMLFASKGYMVALYDIEEKQVKDALADIKKQLKELELSGMLKGSLNAQEQFDCIKEAKSLEECVTGSKHVQECVPEDLALKREVFKQMDSFAGPETILSSSTSCILPSMFMGDLNNKANCIAAHPYNPPYYVPAVEIIPSPWTSSSTVQQTCDLLKEIHMTPITCSREQIGFASSRIQYAILNECLNLVNDGILTANDVDKMVTDGLAMRYVWMGPLKTAHLNAEGIENYIERYGPTINRVSQTMKQVPSWKSEDAKGLIKQMEEILPLHKLQEGRSWRDERLIALSAFKKQMQERETTSSSNNNFRG